MGEYEKKAQEVREFKKHLDETSEEMLTNGYNDEHDIIIGINNKTIRLGLNAESFELLMDMLNNELS